MDRELQDEVIRYLAEARLRTGKARSLPLKRDQAAKAERFARFLARRYYRDRLHRSFRYSRGEGRAAEDVVDSAGFDTFLDECVLGSLGAARQVGAMALESLSKVEPPGLWWGDLLQYESAYFLQAATSEPAVKCGAPTPGSSAVCLDFEWDLPDLLARLKNQTSEGARRRTVTLIFSRTAEGRIYVVEADAPTAAIFRSVDGRSLVAAIAAAAGVSPARAQQVLSEMSGLGAVRLPG